MIAVWFARIVGIVVALLAIGGYFVEGEHLLGITNADIALDIIRTALAIALLIVGFARVRRAALNVVLGLFGASYVLLAILGLVDAEVFGMLPTGLTGFDLAFHLVVGLVAIGVIFIRPGGDESARAAGTRSATGVKDAGR